MTALDGWAHDRYGNFWMLNGEALLALVCVAGGLIALQRINASRARALTPTVAVLPLLNNSAPLLLSGRDRFFRPNSCPRETVAAHAAYWSCPRLARPPRLPFGHNFWAG